MRILSLYQDRKSVIHKIDAVSKILYIITAILIPIIVPTKTAALICMFFSISLLLIAKVFKKVIPLISFSFIILLSIIVIQGLFRAGNKTPAFSIGSLVFYKEGLNYAFKICIKVINILCAFSLLVLTTKPSELIESLVMRGLSPKIGYVLSSVLQIIPQMMSTMDTITDAQRSRGMETEGKLSVRIKAFFPLLGPAVMNSLVSTRERAMALEVRAFNSKNKKTYLNQYYNSTMNKVVKIFLILCIIFAIVWRILV